MPPLTDTVAMLGISVVLCSALLSVLRAWRLLAHHRVWANLVTALCLVLLFAPLGEARLPVVAYVRGVSSDLSITLIALAVWRFGCLVLAWRAVPKQEEFAVMAAIAVAALFLYPLALGLADWDPYRAGWGSWGMLLALLLLCAWSLAKGWRVLPALVALALLAWSLGLLESTNLWDYLLDPWLSIFALGFVVHKVFIKCVLSARARAR